MQDKLIEAAQAFIDKLALVEPAINGAFGFQAIHGAHYSGPNYGKELAALKEAIAAVRAHDAGTDETERDSSGDSRIPASVEGLYSWAQIEDAILTRWDGSEELEHWLKLLRYELKIDPEPPASHAAESAPPIPFEDWWASQGRFIDPDTEDVPWFDKRKGLAEAAYDAGQSSVKFAKFYSHMKAAESIAQLDAELPSPCRHGYSEAGQCSCFLDAEDPAEPVEDVVGEMLDVWFDEDMPENQDDRRKCMTRSLAVARKGYVKMEDVEKAIEKAWHKLNDGDDMLRLLDEFHTALAPKPEPAKEVVDSITQLAMSLQWEELYTDEYKCRVLKEAIAAALVEGRVGK